MSFENAKTSKSVRNFGEMDTFLFIYKPIHSGLEYGEQYELTLSCHFQFSSFPFDSHKCRIEFGDYWYQTGLLNLSSTTIMVRDYPVITPEDDPFIINDLPYSYEFQLEALPAFEINVAGLNYSFNGVLLTLERKSVGCLLGGYYYPTTAFALLSMISYLIDADIVSILLMKQKRYFLDTYI